MSNGSKGSIEMDMLFHPSKKRQSAEIISDEKQHVQATEPSSTSTGCIDFHRRPSNDDKDIPLAMRGQQSSQYCCRTSVFDADLLLSLVSRFSVVDGCF